MNEAYLSHFRADNTVLMVIDCQNDFVAPDNAFQSERPENLIPNIKEAIDWAHSKQIPVIYTQETHRRQKIDYGLELERGDPQHCLEGTKGWEIVPELTPQEDDYIVVKRRYSAFYLTDLELLLKSLGRENLILTGADTNVCVYACALEAQARNFRTIALSDCTSGTTQELHEAFLQNIDYILGEVMTLPELKTRI